MKRIIALTAALPIALSASVLSLSTTAHADDNRICRGVIGSAYIDGNVIVPKGATCTLRKTRVDGDVKVGNNARLFANGVTVDGNIQTGAAKRVVVRPAANGKRPRVDGNIQLKKVKNGGIVRRAVVNGDIQLFNNRGLFQVRGNNVDGNLQCKSNKPKPQGANNRVNGNKENQCRGM